MDDRRFDALTRGLASGGSRRQLLKGLLGFAGAAVMGSVARDAEAARRPTPNPKPVRCPGIQTWNGSACVCPSGTQCGPDCCGAGGQCCDNACCYGTCYGEELCCPAAQQFCAVSGECCAPGLACLEDGTCDCVPNCNGFTCGSDGCGGTCECSSGEECLNGACLTPCTQSYECAGATCTCLDSVDPNEFRWCMDYAHEAGACATHADCPSGAVCIYLSISKPGTCMYSCGPGPS